MKQIYWHDDPPKQALCPRYPYSQLIAAVTLMLYLLIFVYLILGIPRGENA